MEGSDKIADAILYKKIIGSLIFLCNNRSNIVHGIRLISRYIVHQRFSNWLVAKRILRYTKDTLACN